jgi:hypothetical protein
MKGRDIGNCMRIHFFVLCIFISAGTLFAQAQSAAREEIWVTSVVESSFFSVTKPTIGGGAALGYGDGLSIGLKAVFFSDVGMVNSLELNFLLRYYILRQTSRSGLFVQLNLGPVLFFQVGRGFSMPSEIGTFSAGLSLGWRFLFGKYFFLEPTVRAGTPYLVGVGLSAGVRF